MQYSKLEKLFHDIKTNTNLDFVYLNASELGDCPSCVIAELVSKYGENTHGIFADYWSNGMNACYLENCNKLSINHNVTDNQYEQIKTICQQHGYNFSPTERDRLLHIVISEKKH